MNIKQIETKKDSQFYPTPREFLEKICQGIKWRDVRTVLEPSAGKGDIVDYLKFIEESTVNVSFDIDTIEIEENLQHILKGKNYRLVHDNFLSFDSLKTYDLIIMNPPFRNAEEHLLKAIQIQQKGGSIICIMNAETIKNPYALKRKELLKILEKNNAEIQFYENEFLYSERKTNVQVAVIKVTFSKIKRASSIYEQLKNEEDFSQNYHESGNELIDADYIKAITQQYYLEVKSCVRFIEEYEALKPYILESFTDSMYNEPVLELRIGGKQCDKYGANKAIRMIRKKYWSALFKNPRFTKGMTSEQISENLSNLEKLSDYDFSFYNIKTFQIEMVKGRMEGIKKCIIDLFDELSHEYSWLPETGRNVHYFNGWSTNKAHLINKKVIIPLDVWSKIWKRFEYSNYRVIQKLSDIEKVFDYLNGTPGRDSSLCQILQKAENEQQTKKIETTYFYLDFYKKGTCHISFKDDDLLKRFNIMGAQHKAWLPPSYGKKSYDEMSQKDQEIIDSLEGKHAYEKVFADPQKYLFSDSLLPNIRKVG